MNMKKIILTVLGLALFTTLSSCIDDLDTAPKVELTLEQLLENDPNAVEGILSRLYASFALSGPSGPGSSDISDDPGESPFLRGIVNLQDFTADGMKNRWGDDGLDQLTTTSEWTSNNKFFRYLYNRAYYTIPQCNNLLNVLSSASTDAGETVVSEVRFLRALAYFYVIDVFGKGVLATDENFGQSELLPESTREELFNYVESELLEIEPLIGTFNGYGRANTYVVDMLLAKLYINAEVYTGTPRYDQAYTYVNKVITEGDNYEMNDYTVWTDGYPSTKFRNTTFNSEYTPTSFSGTDFPLYRLADAYLMYAECALRGAAGASMTDALNYVNLVRTRSNATAISMGDLNLDFIIDERGRELNLEGHRRTDLIRFGKFTGGSYLWPWKGGTVNGSSIPDTYKVFPIPQTALEANPNLQQNTGY